MWGLTMALGRPPCIWASSKPAATPNGSGGGSGNGSSGGSAHGVPVCAQLASCILFNSWQKVNALHPHCHCDWILHECLKSAMMVNVRHLVRYGQKTRRAIAGSSYF